MMDQKKIRVFLCDDHSLFREGVKAVLRQQENIEIVGEASDGKQAIEVVPNIRPDIVLMDIEMPEMNGFEATRRIKQTEKDVKILILTMYEEEELVARCLDAGASGFLLKDVPPAQLLYAINEVSKGGKYLSPSAASKVVDHLTRRGPAADHTETRYDRLSDREREVLKLLADGLSIKEIATKLDLSVKTVDVHKYNLMRKLDIHDRAELIKYAIRNKLIRLPVSDVLTPKAKSK